MKRQTEQKRRQLIELLADGRFHSGEDLGQALAVSRAAVSKHIQALMQLGLDIFRVTGKGYKLSAPIQLLDTAKIAVHRQHPQASQVEVLNVVSSTNDHLRQQMPNLNNGDACLAEAQTAGRGRQGRTWVSPFGANLYCSLFWRFSGGYQNISGLSLVVGIALRRVLAQLGAGGVKLKWPNDVYHNGAKLAGILVEVEGQMDLDCQCIIGIGLNLQMPTEGVAIDQAWTDLTQVFGQPIDKNRLVALLLDELQQVLLSFEQQGLAPFQQQWQNSDQYFDKPVVLHLGNAQQVQGVAKGINNKGALLVETAEGLKAYYGGEISVRPS